MQHSQQLLRFEIGIQLETILEKAAGTIYDHQTAQVILAALRSSLRTEIIIENLILYIMGDTININLHVAYRFEEYDFNYQWSFKTFFKITETPQIPPIISINQRDLDTYRNNIKETIKI